MIFGGPPPRITEEEFRRALARIDRLNNEERDEVWLIFAGDMDEDGQLRGIDKQELERRLTWMKSHTDKHKLDNEEIEALAQELASRL